MNNIIKIGKFRNLSKTNDHILSEIFHSEIFRILIFFPVQKLPLRTLPQIHSEVFIYYTLISDCFASENFNNLYFLGIMPRPFAKLFVTVAK